MKNLKTQILLLIILTLCSELSFAQSKKTNTIEKINSVVTELNNQQSSDIIRDTVLEKNLTLNRRLGNKPEVERLQNEMIEKYKLNKDNSEIKLVSPSKANYFNHQSDNPIQTNMTLITSDTGYCTHNSISEQLGPNTGRIWNINLIDQYLPSVTDSIKIHYSDDNGINWNHFATYPWAFPQFYQIENAIDVEIAISTYTNDKMLFIVFSCRGYNTVNLLGLIRVDVGNNPGLCSQQLFNYGVLSAYYDFYTPQLACDNSNNQYMPYIHICSSGFYYDNYGNIMRPIRYAAIINPFNIYAPIYFPDASVYIPSSFDLRYLDMCAFTLQGIDYVFFVDEGSSIYEKNITVIQYTGYSALTGGGGYALVLGNSTNKLKQTHISSDGRNIMIVGTYEYGYLDNDIQYFRSSTGVTGFTSGFIDYSTMDDNHPRITSELNGNGKFFISYYKQTNYGFWGIYLVTSSLNQPQGFSKMISTNEMSTFYAGGSVPVRTRDNDCFVTWMNYGYNNNCLIYSVTGCSQNIVLTNTLNLKLFIEGFYNQTLNEMSMIDTIKVFLRNFSAPYNIIDSAKVPLNKSGIAAVNFANLQNGINYFISVKHRNSFETWSRYSGILFSGNNFNYDFSSARVQAYGENQKQVDNSPVRFAIYSGDVNQDGVADAADIILIYNDASNLSAGYLKTDLSGDSMVDVTDLIISYNNVVNIVTVARP